MRHAVHARSLVATVSCILALLLLSSAAHAQFDVGSLKKKAEKTAKKLGSDGGEKQDQEEATETESDAPKRNPASMTPDPVSENASETIKTAYYALQPLLDIRSVPQGMLADKKEAQNFYDHCKEANYPVRRSQVEEAIASDPGTRVRDEYNIKTVMETFPEHLAGLIKEYYVQEINNAIEVAYAEKSKGASRSGAALAAAESALLVADGILINAPDNAEVQALRKDAQAAVSSMDAAHDAVYASSFNKDHAGEIVFSSQPVVVGSENASAIKDAFTANEDIYGMMYFKGTFKEVTNGSNYAYTALLVDGNEKERYNFKLTEDQGANTWLKSEIIPDPALSTTRGAALFTDVLSKLSPRRHTIIVRTTDDLGKTIAEGTFTLDCSSGLDRIAGVHDGLVNKKMAAVKLPAPAMRNAALEKEFKDALREWKETPLKVVITESDWTIQHHPVTGAITSRTINTTVAFKKPDGGCRMFEISFRQQYQGRKYGKAQQYGVGDSADMPCENVK